MAEENIKIDFQLLLPGVEAEDDACLLHLERDLQGHKNLQRAHIDRQKSPACLCLHYDPDVLSIDEVTRLAERAGTRIINRYHHVLLGIEGMDCSDCVQVIEHSFQRMDGILAAKVNYPAGKIRLEYDSYKTDQRAIRKRLQYLGYPVPSNGIHNWYQRNRELLFSLSAGLVLSIGWIGEVLLDFPQILTVVFYLAAYLLAGWDITRHAWSSLRERQFDTHVLMIIAALGAALIGEFAEGALLLFLFSLGHALEERALNRARKAIQSLADLSPKSALVRRKGVEVSCPVEQIQLGETVIIHPGSRLPVDGEIISGESSLDQSPITGESLPVDKTPGDKVFAGSINGEGALEIRVTRLAKDSTLARVIHLVEEAQTQKSLSQQLVERFERIFVPATIGLALLMIVIPPIFGVPFQTSFLRAMTLLVAVSPCALALGAPTAILAGITRAARNGILIKAGAHLENLGQIRVMAFDKTGTLTSGRPEVTDVLIFSNPHIQNQQDLLALAAGIESRSGHPFAQAILRSAQEQRLFLPQVEYVRSLTGRGVQANVNGMQVFLGSPNSPVYLNIPQSTEINQHISDLESEGKSIVLLAVNDQVIGLIGIADTLRPEAGQVVASLKKIGIQRTVMLTGDHLRVARKIAGQVGVDDFRADLLPEDKLEAIKGLTHQYGLVAMVGDGVNDAPALARATVGIAMGSAGNDVALETADVALLQNDLMKLASAVGLGRATRTIILQNLVIALGVILILGIASLLGITSIGITIIIHEGSTLVVVFNSLRLLNFKSRDHVSH